MIPIVLIGAGGHCRSCIDVIESTKKFEIVAIVGLPSEIGSSILNYPIAYCDDDLAAVSKQTQNFLITVGQIKTSRPRESLFQKVRQLGGQFPTIISPHAYVSKHAHPIGAGTIVMHSAIVNAAANIGENTIVNSRALIEHDAHVGSHCHVSTGAIVNGGTRVGDHCFIGSGAVTREYVDVPANTIVAANCWYDGKTTSRSSRARP